MTIAEMHYIRSFKDSKTVEELAQDLNSTVRKVKAALKKIAAEPETAPGTPPKTHYVISKGTVSMTKEQSQKDDPLNSKGEPVPKKSSGQRFMDSRLAGCVGEVYPNAKK